MLNRGNSRALITVAKNKAQNNKANKIESNSNARGVQLGFLGSHTTFRFISKLEVVNKHVDEVILYDVTKLRNDKTSRNDLKRYSNPQRIEPNCLKKDS